MERYSRLVRPIANIVQALTLRKAERTSRFAMVCAFTITEGLLLSYYISLASPQISSERTYSKVLLSQKGRDRKARFWIGELLLLDLLCLPRSAIAVASGLGGLTVHRALRRGEAKIASSLVLSRDLPNALACCLISS